MSNVLPPSETITISTDAYMATLPKVGEEVIIKNAAAQRALRDPLPGPMMEAMDTTGPITVKTTKGDVEVRRLVAYDITLLKKHNSPFYRQLMDPTDETTYDDDEQYEMIYQFVNPPLTVKKVADKGREFFRNTAIEQIGLVYFYDDLKPVVDAIIKQILSAFSTLVQHGSQETDSLDGLIDKYSKNDEEAEKMKADAAKKKSPETTQTAAGG